MAIASSPSDYTSIDVDYSTGKGFYTDKDAVSDMLQIPAFTSSTFPSQAQVGKIIKNIDKYSGASVHKVTEKLDSGKIIFQKKVKILKKDTLKSLEKKVLKIEHLIYPKAIIKFLTSL